MKSVHIMFRSVFMSFVFLWIIPNGFLYLPSCVGQIISKLKPNLTLDDRAVLLDEAQAAPLTLTQLHCADPDGGLPVVSVEKMVPSKPCGKCFTILPCGGEWCLDFERFEELDITKVNSYTVYVKCVAQNRQIVKDTIQVQLFKRTQAPIFKPFSRVVTLVETQTQEVTLQKVTCFDPDNTTVKVDLSIDSKVSKAGCTKCFSLEPCGNDWCLKFIPQVGKISFSVVPNYPMTLTCTDLEGQTVTSDIEVRITKNSPPHFAKLFASTTVTGTQSVRAGTKLFQVIATDQENDALYYTLKTTPDVPQISIGFTDGVIVAKGDLSQVCAPVVSCEVMVNDGFNPDVGSMVLDLTLQDANSAPSITNMDGIVQVPEDTAVGAAIYKIHVLDEDKLSDMTLILKANPPSVQGHFELKGDEIVLKSALNYEDPSMRTVQLSLGIKDSGGCSSPTKILTLQVTDVNEPPKVTNEKISVIVYEGVISVRPEWNVEDEDFVDTKKYRIVSGNEDGRFAIDSNTGVITSLVDYDVDKGRMPRSRTFTVEVEDKGGLTSTGEVTLSIKDANDNAPFVLSGSRNFVVSECTLPGTSITRLTTDDYDSYHQFNSRVHLLAAKDGPLSLLSSGELVMTQTMSAGDTASVEAWAMDAGIHPGPLKSHAPVYLTVTCVHCPTTTTTTYTPLTRAPIPGRTNSLINVLTTSVPTALPAEVEKKSFDVSDNLWWMVLSGVLALGLLSLVGWMLWKLRCCEYCGAACRRSPPKHPPTPTTKLTKVRPHTPVVSKWDNGIDLDLRKPPVTPQPPSKPPKSVPALDIPPPETPEPVTVGSDQARIYDFWKERYNEDDYSCQPDRNSKPEPTQDAVNPLDHSGPPRSTTKGVTKSGGSDENKCSII